MSVRQAIRCKARSKRSGVQCQAFAMNGQQVCSAHGGMSPQARKAAARRLEEARASRALASVQVLGDRRDVHPVAALLEAVSVSAAMCAFLEAQVAGLAPRFGGGHVETPEGDVWRPGMVGPDHLGDGAPHVWVRLWNEERDRLARTAALAQRAGVSAAQLELTQDLARRLVDVLRGALRRLGVDPDAEDVRRAVRAELSTGEVIDVD